MPSAQQIIENGPVAQLVSAPPCHGGGRGFKSRQGRNSKHQFRLELVFLLLASGAPGVGVGGQKVCLILASTRRHAERTFFVY